MVSGPWAHRRGQSPGGCGALAVTHALTKVSCAVSARPERPGARARAHEPSGQKRVRHLERLVYLARLIEDLDQRSTSFQRVGVIQAEGLDLVGRTAAAGVSALVM